jgi:murein L,D-transpeptidase YcbB/YkuD
MQNFKFTLVILIILAILVLGGYWAFSTLESGPEHFSRKVDTQLDSEAEEEILAEVKKEEIVIEPIVPIEEKKEEKVEIKKEAVKEITKEVEKKEISSKYEELITSLEKLITDNVYMKKGSKGTRVGTVQNFLNIYNKTSSRIDNDYGEATISAIKKFQKEQGLVADGEAGKNTFEKMVSWLEKQ